jgi:glycosyltransferase involved in cell wall biosynthesis
VSGLVVFMPDFAGGGAERTLMDLAVSARDRGVDTTLVVARGSGALAERVPDRLPVVVLGTRHTLGALLPLARLLRARRPAGMLTGITHSNLVALAARRLARVGTHVVVTEHTHMGAARARPDNLRSRFLPRLVGHVYPGAEHIVAVSEGVADALAAEAGIDRSRIEVIYNPVDCATVRAAAAEAPEWVPPGAAGPLVIAVGRLHPDKCFDLLIRAVAGLSRRRDLGLVICGEGETRGELEALTRELGVADRVWLPGFMANPYPLMRTAQAFALTSRREGLPTVLLEAACLDLPIVATDCHSGPREILASVGAGQLVPVSDQEALEHALDRALDGHRGPDGFAPDRDGRRRFDPGAVTARYMELLGVG